MSIARQSFTNLLVTLCVVLVVALAALLFKPDPPATVPRTSGPSGIPVAVPVASPDGSPTELEHLQLLTDAKWVETTGHSADTFRISTGGSEQVFCLYFVDALENTFTDIARVKQQAAFFTGATHEAVIESGRDAAKEAAQLLRTRPFKLWTRWQKVPGTDRYFAMLSIEHEAGRWSYLDEILVSKGYAQAEGATAIPPDGQRSLEAHITQLRKQAGAAREKRSGIWSRIR